ncbi:hypothetical protein H1R20_g5499, partial [Candolleomyces eurysporus]
MPDSKAKAWGEIPAPATHVPQNARGHHWKRYLAAGAAVLVLLSVFSTSSQPRRRPPRLPPAEAEKLFLTVPNGQHALAASLEYATHPHLAGSSEDFDDAKAVLKLFQEEFGIHPPNKDPIFKAGSRQSRHATLSLTGPLGPKHPTAWIDTYFPVLNTPLNHSLQLLNDEGHPIFEADLEEDGDPLDPDAAKYKDAVPAWHGLSFDGTATGEFVYANYGTLADYVELLAKGTDLKGKIVIARYGRIFRGLKIKAAQELGAAGVVIYSDPRDDGYVTTSNGYAPYPHGPARNPSSVQRGSVQYLSLYPGDPTTPGYPAYEDAVREEGINIPKIPSLPISWRTAENLLPELRDGSEPDSYPVLNGKVSTKKLKLVNHVDTKVTPIWNTMAAIPGHIRDEVVVIGCHRDAWVLGAADPTSGTVSLLEIVRGFGTLLRQGWRPLRTVVFASWDAEEYGLVGSVEWGEDFHQWIAKHAVTYLNVDVSVSGSRWNVQASPSLVDIIKKTALDVPHPTKPGLTLWDSRKDDGPFRGVPTECSNTTYPTAQLNDKVIYFGNGSLISEAPAADIPALGSGSDYTVFLQRIGIASTDQGFGYTDSDAVYHYHSVYDTQRWQEVYADPEFKRHVAVAKHLGLLALRFTDGIILPLNTTRYSYELDLYLDRVEDLALSKFPYRRQPDFADLRTSIKTLQEASIKLDAEKVEAEKKLREFFDKLPQGPHHHCRGRGPLKALRRLYFQAKNAVRTLLGLPPLERPVPRHIPQTPEALAFALANDELTPWGHQDEWRPPFPIHKFIKAVKRVQRANKKLKSFEQGFISEEGIKDREWYRHLGVAPGKWLGYGATTFPALTEAITIEGDLTLVKYEAERLTHLIDRLAVTLSP